MTHGNIIVCFKHAIDKENAFFFKTQQQQNLSEAFSSSTGLHNGYICVMEKVDRLLYKQQRFQRALAYIEMFLPMFMYGSISTNACSMEPNIAYIKHKNWYNCPDFVMFRNILSLNKQSRVDVFYLRCILGILFFFFYVVYCLMSNSAIFNI